MSATPILTAAQMRAAEQALFATGIPEYDVMERAGAAVADVVWRAGGLRDTLVLCGSGNNGGDGFVIARLLRERGLAVRVAASADSRTPSSRQARALWNGPVEDVLTARPATQVVDALFGTGLTRGLDDGLAAKLCQLAGEARLTYTVDLPSGVRTDDGALLSDVPLFDICVALGALKPAHVLYPAASRFNRLICADIGILVEDAAVRVLAPPRLFVPAANAHKYTRGLVAVLGGAMPGASALAALAVAHSGAGYVRLIGASPMESLPHAIVQQQDGTATAFGDRRIAISLIGPGMGRSDEAVAQARIALAAGHPAVIDADGLLALRSLGFAALPNRAILTPHQGEFDSLFGALSGSRIAQAQHAAAQSGAVVILKGSHSIVAAPDGRAAVSHVASSWLSTAGTGDVLAGICAARLAVTGDPFHAACEAVWLHGEAARRAGAAFVADELITHLPAAIASRL
ncbi:bifunctional ADP-dependent NAD(P)H-hydrate dehydratase/NAD(P)H-hydrate epimerase [Sphingobium sp. SCG-1]|uniref:NAD(P)H-hydrate dehydratase n=1 Tax=Sphingobium sp. SCG-1 TaxID=2072936 RepID=UPI000CD67BFB|nr:NAD(P)H-hydrate dehydratase [Sphingobium sp. SCG-1]AUW58542.1 bifunctional ADP-dependent NAD(P)H-hydrate dehydratase/NAD(P)H-hydrate epimerase [Sphingobium sp. SCG-1]